MQQAQVSNPNDFKVVSFHNKESFVFTPEMGCMYDGRPINGIHGSPGIDAGETITLPYHIGKLLAKNLAKRVFNTSPAATVDPAGIPTGVPVWNETKLQELADTYITELYSEAKPIAQSETDRLMAKVEEYKKMVDTLLSVTPKIEEKVETTEKVVATESPKVFADKQEVIAELEKRGIKFDRRANKANLEKLLA